MSKTPHILNASSNLLGIALLIITGLNLTHATAKSFADQIAWGAAVCFSLSCLLSYTALRNESADSRQELWADRIFLIGLFVLVISVVVLAIDSSRMVI